MLGPLILVWLWLPSSAVGQEAATSNDAPATARECLERLGSDDTRWEVFADCEKRLLLLPAAEVMPLVAAHPLYALPARPIWNGRGTPELERDGPLPWRVHWSLQRVWRHHLRYAPIDDLRKILVATSGGRMDDDLAYLTLFQHHRRFGVPGRRPDPRDAVFDEAAVRVLRDPRRSVEDRCEGASVLQGLGRRAETLEVLLRLPSTDRVIGLLAGTAEIDPRAVPKAFGYLEATIRDNPGQVHAAYFAAISVARVLQASSERCPFSPDPSDPKYQPPPEGGGLRDEFFQETVDNALAWWAAHRDEYTPEGLERRRAEEARARAEVEERERREAAEREHNARVPLQTGQRRRVTLGAVVTFATDRDAVQYLLHVGSSNRSSVDPAADHAARHGKSHAAGSAFEVVEARGDALARVRFDSDGEVAWASSREALENATAER